MIYKCTSGWNYNSQRLKIKIPSHWGGGFQHINFGDTQIVSL